MAKNITLIIECVYCAPIWTLDLAAKREQRGEPVEYRIHDECRAAGGLTREEQWAHRLSQRP